MNVHSHIWGMRSYLTHEVFDDAMEWGTLVAQLTTILTCSFFSAAQAAKVFNCAWASFSILRQLSVTMHSVATIYVHDFVGGSHDNKAQGERYQEHARKQFLCYRKDFRIIVTTRLTKSIVRRPIIAPSIDKSMNTTGVSATSLASSFAISAPRSISYSSSTARALTCQVHEKQQLLDIERGTL